VTGASLALVLTAAGLHASWNALAKRGRDPVVFLWWTNCGSTVLLMPLGLAELARAGFPADAAPFVLATSALHTAYFYALGRSYGSGAFSLVYPVARGLGVALVAVVAFFVFDERLSPLGILGVALVATGILALHLGAAPRVVGARRGGSATAWALATGLTIAAYSLVDKAGVQRLGPVPYVMLMEAGCAIGLLPAVIARSGAVRREWTQNRAAILAVAAMSAGAYALVLFAFRLSKAGYVVAARETSIVLSALIGSLWLGEGRLAPRLAGAAVVLAGVVCIALAR
jgi:drug/metabolite transporter (DMT)-like permease